MELLETESLCFSYSKEEVLVLDHIDLKIKAGSITAILGHNGCGKSTLAKHFNAVCLPTGGKVWVDGRDTATGNVLDIRRAVGMVFQNPDNQIVANVVEEDVAFGPENIGVASEEIRRRVDEALREVGMMDFVRHAPHLLSGGQKQRIAIAGVIAMEPKCIILDEATAMLDPGGRREVLETIHRLNREKKITVVMITHHMDEAETADRIIVLEHGKIYMDGTPREIFSQIERLRAVSLTAPDMMRLLYDLRKAGMDVPETVRDAEECADVIYRALSM